MATSPPSGGDRPRAEQDLDPTAKTMREAAQPKTESAPAARSDPRSVGEPTRALSNEQAAPNPGVSPDLASQSARMMQDAGAQGTRMLRDMQQEPFALMQQMSREMDRVFESFFSMNPWSSAPFSRAARQLSSMPLTPQAEVSEQSGNLLVEVDVPGVAREDLDVRLEAGMLTIRGQRRATQRGMQRESNFYRTIPLPRDADVERARATLENGVLCIEVPRAERMQARSIPIEGSAGS